MKIIKWGMYLWAMFLFLFLITACAKEETNGISSKQTTKGGEAPLADKLRIGYQKSSILLFLKEKGSLEKKLSKQGVKVSWHEFQSGPPLLEALNAEKIDIGYVGGAPAVFSGAASDSELIYLAYEPEVYRAIVVPENSTIKTVKDLKGKKVGFGKGSSAHYLVLTALEHAGLTLDDITPVYLQPSDARGAFERGSIDAWAIWDPYLADAEKNGEARIIADASGLPRQYGFIVGRRHYFQENRQIRKNVINELEAIHEMIQADKKSAAEQFSRNTGISKNVWEQTLNRREYGVFALTAEVIDAQQKLADAFLEVGLIRKKVTVQNAVFSD